MSSQHYYLAQKYAIAFVNVYGAQLDKQMCTALLDLARKLKKKVGSLLLLTTPQITHAVKHQALKKLLPSHCFDPLLDILIRDKRIVLLPYVLGHIVSCYYKQHNIVRFAISAAHDLTEQELKAVVDFLEAKTNTVVTYRYKTDKKLIAGIRAQSHQFIWECSVRQRLQYIERALIG